MEVVLQRSSRDQQAIVGLEEAHHLRREGGGDVVWGMMMMTPVVSGQGCGCGLCGRTGSDRIGKGEERGARTKANKLDVKPEMRRLPLMSPLS